MYRTGFQSRDVGFLRRLGFGADRQLELSILSAPRLPAAAQFFGVQALPVSALGSFSKSNAFWSCTCTGPHSQGMDISELEFVQIIIIVLVMTFMTVVIIYLLNHYRRSALAFLSRLNHTQGDRTTQRGMCGHLNRHLPSFMMQPQLCRFQPTYPVLPQEIINLPPIICLSDGEELPPYKGSCNLQLRPPEQQLELSRASVRAPPNRTIFKSDLIDIYLHSVKPQIFTNNVNAKFECPLPSYSEVMADYCGLTASQRSNNASPLDTRLGPDGSHMVFHSGSPESTSTSSDVKAKS